MRTQRVPGFVIGALGVQVQVEAAQQRPETVGILDLLDRVLLGLHPQAVAARSAVERGFKKTLGVPALELHAAAIFT
jgi:hypothetical protein